MTITKSRRRLISASVRYVILTVWAVLAFFPIYWMVSTSFKPSTQWFSWPPVYFPDPPTLSNYMNVWLGTEEYDTAQLTAERDVEVPQVAADRPVDQLVPRLGPVRRLPPLHQLVHGGLALLDRRHRAPSRFALRRTVPHRADAVAWSP